VEAAFGYPAVLQEIIRHPVVWIGDLIARLDKALNQQTLPEARRRINGVIALAVVLVVTIVPAWAVQVAMVDILPDLLAVFLLGLGASSLLAQRSLWRHVLAVAIGLERYGLAGGRLAVSRIVGRDPESLDEAGVARAAIESLAENFSDGVVAPSFWCALFGLPGLVAYKAINTADSMVGHLTPQHEAFGWASARLDDLVNLPASRLSAVWIIAAAALIGEDHPGKGGMDPKAAWKAIRRDAKHHRSPNAGWPEAAIAGALGLRLAGPRVYDAMPIEDPWMGDGRAEATAADIRRALDLYKIACGLQMAVLGLLVGLIWLT